MKVKLRTVAEIEASIALMEASISQAGEIALRDRHVDMDEYRRVATHVRASITVMQWMLGKDTKDTTEFCEDMARRREMYPDCAATQPVQPAPMTFSEAVAEFEALCDASERWRGSHRVLEVQYRHHPSSTVLLMYKAYVAGIVVNEESETLEGILARVDELLNPPPPEQDVPAALDAVDVEALARGADDGMTPVPETSVLERAQFNDAQFNGTSAPVVAHEAEQMPGGLPEPPVFDSAEEDAAHAG